MSELPADKLRGFLESAYERAPAVKRLFDDAGVVPADITGPGDLERLPVTPKERLIEAQREDPPFGGYLGVESAAISRIFVSSGPVYEPETEHRRGQGYDQAFATVGIGPGDIVLNTWTYHLFPAGLVIDDAFRRVGATVIPGGTGNTELQAEIIVELGVTVIAASTAFFQALVDQIERKGHSLPGDWKVRAALLGGEFGNWMAKRRTIEQTLAIKTFTAYGTGDLGLIGWECSTQNGYHILDDMFVQVCDPATGQSVADGESGEIVVTAMNPAWPLIRFGTGDASYIMTEPCSCGDPAPRIAPLLGRTGQARKVREVFVYPRHLDEVRARVESALKVQGRICQRDGTDEIDLRVEVDNDGGGDLDLELREAFTTVTRLRAGEIEFVKPDVIGTDEQLLVDARNVGVSEQMPPTERRGSA